MSASVAPTAPSSRTRIRRIPDRAHYDAETIAAIVDAAPDQRQGVERHRRVAPSAQLGHRGTAHRRGQRGIHGAGDTFRSPGLKAALRLLTLCCLRSP